jgi:hypothetical protein
MMDIPKNFRLLRRPGTRSRPGYYSLKSMPNEAIRINHAVEVLPPEQLAKKLATLIGQARLLKIEICFCSLYIHRKSNCKRCSLAN